MMKTLLVVSSILGMASATRVYCDLHTGVSNVSPIGNEVSVSFNCNNDHNNNSEKGTMQYLVQALLPCNGCNRWYDSNQYGYQINPKQNTDKPKEITYWLKWNGQECNTHNNGGGTYSTIECNV